MDEWQREAERVLGVATHGLSREDRRTPVPAVGPVPEGTIDALLAAHADHEPDGTWPAVAFTALVAHEVSIHRGSVNPLTEHLARALCENAAKWRPSGPEPELGPEVSWRDRFVMLAGHDPHPLWDREQGDG
jgi:hypothetical protein